jgi:hypothetical protein
MADDKTLGSLEELLNKISSEYAPNVLRMMGDLQGAARELNSTFGQGGDRINEMQKAIGEANIAVTKLGGSMDDTLKVMTAVAEGTRRNVLAAKEDISKLYAAAQVLDVYSVKELVSKLTDVGVQFSKAGEELENAMSVTRNLGLNTKQIMEDVRNNMEKMNKYNFAGGVEGLTKMAAQASIFRFDMNDTFNVMEKALDPEGAIELSSAFQRMGVTAGDLTDPFQLMYKSLNDPEGLQKSLAQMTEKFTYFDDKTKTFKIGPEGMLQMRELSKQTGISYESLSKSALAAANLGAAMRQVNGSIKFDSEEDKQLLANISRMGKGGEYEVNITNEKGDLETKKLSQLNQEQIDKLIKEQKEGPKTLEEYAKGQMKTMEIVQADLHFIRVSMETGIATARQVMDTEKLIRDITTTSTDIISKAMPSSGTVRKETEEAISTILSASKELLSGDASKERVMELGNTLNAQMKNLEGQGLESLREMVTKLISNTKEITDKYGSKIMSQTNNTKRLQSTKPKESKATIDQTITMGGTTTFKVEAGGANTQEIERYLNSPQFKEAVFNAIKNMDANSLKTLKNSLKITS